MEHRGTQTAPDQGLEVGKADEAAVAPAALKEVSGGPNLEKVGNGKPNAIDAQALAGDDIVDLVQKIENLKKNDDQCVTLVTGWALPSAGAAKRSQISAKRDGARGSV
jgi:hypothetical protein